MFLLDKVFKVRNEANPEGEMSFLEHLEDLRKMIGRMVLTLLVATVACFVFKDKLIDFLRLPLDRVYTEQEVRALPDSLSFGDWEKAKKNAAITANLSEQQRNYFYSSLEGDNAQFHTEAALLYRSIALLELKEEERDAFIEKLPDTSEEMRTLLKGLASGGPNSNISKSDDLRLMGAFKPTEAFMLSIKLSFFAAIVVTFPLQLFFVLQFVLPGLHKNERKALWPALVIGFGLFILGTCFAYFVVLPRALEFFYTFSKELNIENDWRIGYYISFATQFVLIFGLAFELPVIVMTLVSIGILQYQSMQSSRGYAVLAIFVIAAVITPTPDAFTLMLLGVPMYILYEICIWLSYFIDKRNREREEAEERAYLDRLMNDENDAHAEEYEHAEEVPESPDEFDDGKPI